MTRVVLAGCGHAHLEVLRSAHAFAAAGAELVLIDPGRFWYSGRGSGVLGGRFAEEDAVIDPDRLAAACGVRLLADRVVGLDRAASRVLLASGETLGFDLLSLNIGSTVHAPAGLEAGQGAKPIAQLADLRRTLLAAGAPIRVAVLGGGATGCELAGNLLHLGRAARHPIAVTLVGQSPTLVPTAPAGLQAAALDSLTRRGAVVHLGQSVASAGQGVLRLTSGAAVPYDHLVLATGLVAQPAIQRLGLSAREAGLRVQATLQSVDDVRIFAAGDCAAIEGHNLAKLGVYGVRAAPVLARNILAMLAGTPLEAYRPQKHALSILDLADGRGLAMRAGFWHGGRAALGLKHFLDQRFLDRYQRLYAGR
ncbi:FAD-dependent oxidoreductase [Aureimonas glaciei]|uniref:Pyridine nucleotide-disulfide oxidoreductase n=1 Tax=Aureimonas glaciei TaxID=1776957 RepID=A0A917DKJ5_9HYPH|nr:FAD-dependent oxidoreductase [Aureimonas glaciei]GGD43588.1 pyridine nucleotide-disulfide oxidoreductase [Aureimonas glaciei]